MAQNSNTKFPRLYTDQALKQSGSIILSQDQVHYLRNVLRKVSGDLVRIFNGRDGEWLGSLGDLKKKSGIVLLQESLRAQNYLCARVHLLFSPIKKARMDVLIEKAVELGVSDLHPVVSARTEMRKIKPERLEAQIVEAAEQCERLDLPYLHDLISLEKKLAEWNGPEIYAALERQDACDLSSCSLTGDSAFLIGPEGGFSEHEMFCITQYSNITPVSLGANILRAETAGLFCLSFASISLSRTL